MRKVVGCYWSFVAVVRDMDWVSGRLVVECHLDLAGKRWLQALLWWRLLHRLGLWGLLLVRLLHMRRRHLLRRRRRLHLVIGLLRESWVCLVLRARHYLLYRLRLRQRVCGHLSCLVVLRLRVGSAGEDQLPHLGVNVP